jgi:hypothetical protein
MSKILIVSLDDDIEFTHISYNATEKAVKQGVEKIVTPQIHFFSNYYVAKGYKVYARDSKIEICLNDMIERKEVRAAQNASSMLLSNCFAIIPENSSGFWNQNNV